MSKAFPCRVHGKSVKVAVRFEMNRSKYMEKKYWFPAKPPENGWGLPLAWQGGVVFSGGFVLLIGGAMLLAIPYPGACLAGVFALSALPVAMCRITGEPLGAVFQRETRR